MKGKKLYIVRKTFFASSIREAIKMEKLIPPDDVYIDSDWAKNNDNINGQKIGFNIKKHGKHK